MGDGTVTGARELGSVWERPDAPETNPSLFSATIAALFSVFATWLVFTVLIAIAFLTGVLTSRGLTTEQFFDRAEDWVLLVIVPLTAAVYLFAIRAFGAWFANREIGWPQAFVALALTGVAGALFMASSFGLGVLSILAGCVIVGAVIRWRSKPLIA